MTAVDLGCAAQMKSQETEIKRNISLNFMVNYTPTHEHFHTHRSLAFFHSICLQMGVVFRKIHKSYSVMQLFSPVPRRVCPVRLGCYRGLASVKIKKHQKTSPANAPSIKWGCFGTIKCPLGYHFIEEAFPEIVFFFHPKILSFFS